MSAVPYSPHEKRAPYAPQDEYIQRNETGTAYTHQNGTHTTTTTYAPHSDTGIGYAPRIETTAYPPHEKGNTSTPAVPAFQPQLVHAYTAPSAPTHPQTTPVYSQQPVGNGNRPPVGNGNGPPVGNGNGPPVGNGNGPPVWPQHAQHFTPPTGPLQDWQHGMCDCFDSMSICCLGLWLPCVLYSRTYKRIRTSPSTVRSFSCCNTTCWCQFCCGGNMRQRNEIRYRYNLKGSGLGDFCRHLWCAQCSLCQEELEVRDRERQAAAVYLAGYAKPVQMTYGRQAQ